MQIRRALTVILVVALLAVAGRRVVQASGGRYTILDVPQAGTEGTFANGINPRGDIVGDYTDRRVVSHGFLLHQGRYTILNAPQAGNGTSARGINSRGDIVGNYTDSHGVYHGFLLRLG